MRPIVLLLAVVACSPSAPATPPAGSAAPPARALSPVARAGKQLFFETALSASGAMSCATCHDPAFAYGPPNGLAVQLGGLHRATPGLRAVPSLRYKEYTRGYTDLLDNADGFSQPGPGGGFGWDGRSDSLAEQAQIPLLSPFEMANASPLDVVTKLRGSPSAAGFTQAFGAAAFDDVDAAFAAIGRALQAFQLEDASFHPYNSKYDGALYRQPGSELSAAEQRGLKVFADPATGNCVGCHFHDASLDDGAPPQLSDHTFAALGVPRNPRIPANADPGYMDLGICGPLRGDHTGFTEYCGLFKAPTLRNAATRRAFFHNGVFDSLEQVVRFYNTRDTNPELWYPTIDGVVQKLDDLPARYHANIDTQPPLDGRPRGAPPAMTEQQIHDLICFLHTLTDDFRPGTPPQLGCAG